jgi:hypothetical protein
MISHENKHFALEHLTPMITSHSFVENQILKSALPQATLFALCAFGHWHLVIGHPRNGTLPAMPVPPVVSAVERSKVEVSKVELPDLPAVPTLSFAERSEVERSPIINRKSPTRVRVLAENSDMPNQASGDFPEPERRFETFERKSTGDLVFLFSTATKQCRRGASEFRQRMVAE